MFASRKVPTAQHEDVQVEVIFDTYADLFSIMVSDATSKVQSVVAVPKDDLSRRNNRQLTQSRYSQSTGTPYRIDGKAAQDRKADLMRNLSPINGARSSAYGRNHHSRRIVHFLRPQTSQSI